MSSIRIESVASQPAETILEVESGTLTAGRDEENTMIIDSEAVSRVHGCFFDIHGQWFYRDLNSTNGSVINGVKITPGQIRILREGDIVQLADFPVRFRRLDGESSGTGSVPVLYVFHGDQFETEFPLATPDAKFVVGGANGHLYLDNSNSEVSQAEISVSNSRLELSASVGGVKVILNGMASGGVSPLSDRDEIEIGQYRIVVSDPSSAIPAGQAKMRHAQSGKMSLPANTSPAAAFAGTKPKDWESEDSRRKVMGNRKFVFGTTPEEDDVTGTLALKNRDAAVGRGGEMSAQHRFSKTGSYHEAESSGLGERTQMILGAIVLVLILGAAIYFLI